ncbi:MAG: DHCW motif cupin fold protein [Taibaiella sp.]|nr:DHCW motif cupin fold protein [Taibaiella sp.]
MDIFNENVAINWEEIQAEKIEGETGYVITKVKETGTVKIRHNTYSADFKADHWCEKGHILLVLNGVLIIEFKDGTSVDVTKGNSYVLGDNVQAHKAITLAETEVFIVD